MDQTKESWQLEFRSRERLEPVFYLEQALDLMRTNSLNQTKVDWLALRKEILALVAGAKIAADVYPAIRSALEQLEDHHSHLSVAPELEQLEANRASKRISSSTSVLAASPGKQLSYSPYVGRYEPEGHLHKFSGRVFARVVVPKCPFQIGPEFVRFETRLQHIIAELDADHPAGWIVDLRGNVGGNMWPMLTGIGPILGEGEHLGEFVTFDGRAVWFTVTVWQERAVAIR